MFRYRITVNPNDGTFDPKRDADWITADNEAQAIAAAKNANPWIKNPTLAVDEIWTIDNDKLGVRVDR